jgi:hypothetical protein
MALRLRSGVRRVRQSVYHLAVFIQKLERRSSSRIDGHDDARLSFYIVENHGGIVLITTSDEESGRTALALCNRFLAYFF